MTQQIDIGSLLDLSGKVAIVTGAASGMGRETARYFAAAGAAVVCADMNGAGAETIAAELGGKSIPVTVDVSDEASVMGMMERVKSAFGRLDILVNNAALQNRALLTETSVAYWDKIQAVNLRGPFLCLREAAKLMQASGYAGRMALVMSSISPKWERSVGPRGLTLPHNPRNCILTPAI